MSNQQEEKAFPRIGVGVLVTRGNNVLLGCRRGPRSAGYFGLPGGYLNCNESLEAGARRELWEETGLSDLTLHPLYLINLKISDNHSVDVVFWARSTKGFPVAREPDRVVKWQWCKLSDLPSPLYPPSSFALQYFKSKHLELFIRSLISKFWKSNSQIVHIDFLDEFN